MVILIVGLSGSGKTTVADFFRQKGVPVVRLGDVTQQELQRRHQEAGEKNEKEVRDALRASFGPQVYALRTIPLVQEALKASSMVVVEGIRSQEEVALFTETITPSVLIYIHATDATRHQRLGQRQTRPLTPAEIAQRDRWEKEEMQLEQLKQLATTVINNNGTLEQLHEQVGELLTAPVS